MNKYDTSKQKVYVGQRYWVKWLVQYKHSTIHIFGSRISILKWLILLERLFNTLLDAANKYLNILKNRYKVPLVVTNIWQYTWINVLFTSSPSNRLILRVWLFYVYLFTGKQTKRQINKHTNKHLTHQQT